MARRKNIRDWSVRCIDLSNFFNVRRNSICNSTQSIWFVFVLIVDIVLVILSLSVLNVATFNIGGEIERNVEFGPLMMASLPEQHGNINWLSLWEWTVDASSDHLPNDDAMDLIRAFLFGPMYGITISSFTVLVRLPPAFGEKYSLCCWEVKVMLLVGMMFMVNNYPNQEERIVLGERKNGWKLSNDTRYQVLESTTMKRLFHFLFSFMAWLVVSCDDFHTWLPSFQNHDCFLINFEWTIVPTKESRPVILDIAQWYP